MLLGLGSTQGVKACGMIMPHTALGESMTSRGLSESEDTDLLCSSVGMEVPPGVRVCVPD